MSIERELAEALRGIARQEVSGAVRVASMTTAQRRGGAGLWEKITQRPAKQVIRLTTTVEGQTRRFFMAGKDTLADSEDWLLG